MPGADAVGFPLVVPVAPVVVLVVDAVPHAAASKAMAASAATPPEALLLLLEVFNIHALPLVRHWLVARQMCEPIGGGDAGAWYCMLSFRSLRQRRLEATD
jgi:hypothetical protein